MKEFTNYKYYIYHRDDGSTVVKARSTYAGKNVYGVAICSPDDVFDSEKGKKLAAARCNEKVAELRLKRAIKKYNEVADLKEQLNRYLIKATNYVSDSATAASEAHKRVTSTRNSL